MQSGGCHEQTPYSKMFRFLVPPAQQEGGLTSPVKVWPYRLPVCARAPGAQHIKMQSTAPNIAGAHIAAIARAPAPCAQSATRPLRWPGEAHSTADGGKIACRAVLNPPLQEISDGLMDRLDEQMCHRAVTQVQERSAINLKLEWRPGLQIDRYEEEMYDDHTALGILIPQQAPRLPPDATSEPAGKSASFLPFLCSQFTLQEVLMRAAPARQNGATRPWQRCRPCSKTLQCKVPTGCACTARQVGAQAACRAGVPVRGPAALGVPSAAGTCRLQGGSERCGAPCSAFPAAELRESESTLQRQRPASQQELACEQEPLRRTAPVSTHSGRLGGWQCECARITCTASSRRIS